MTLKTLIKKALKTYNYDRLSMITGIDVRLLKLLRQDKIPNYITRSGNRTIPSKPVLESKFRRNLESHLKAIQELNKK